jgi:FkbM family methyltransferase
MRLTRLRTLIDTRFPGLAVGYRRLRDDAYYRRMRAEPTVFGFRMYGADGMDVNRSASGEVEVFTNLLAGCVAAVDVGANVGFFALLAARAGKPVVAVEPLPSNVQALLKNLELNGAEGVEVFVAALSDRPGVVSLRGGRQGGSLVEGWGGSGSTSLYRNLVPANTLDNLVAGRYSGQRLLVKMDVEGHEYTALQGASATLARTPRPVWILEHVLTENFPPAGNPHFADLFRLFWDHGYAAEAVEVPGRPVTPEDVASWIATGSTGGRLNYVFRAPD